MTFKPLGISDEQLALMKQNGLKLDKRTQRSLTSGADNPKPDAGQISKFESSIGYSFPDDYRKFLIDHNGGKPSPNGVSLPEIASLKGTALSYLHGFNHGYSDYTLRGVWKKFSKELKKNYIPIGGDPAGNYFLMDLSESGNGGIYFWNRDVLEGDDESEIVKIAGSFSEFLNLLH
ncbi:SMI1/KNR4 family protein [Burkholderia plantarii]|uniref:SMI1/KNR4 family protein n=1 Tax=Burkholderia plantarii TaxID=41899 RepID=UPI001FC81312|nr:SMI1/KNR4 family protein [Burkholderia plantarii]